MNSVRIGLFVAALLAVAGCVPGGLLIPAPYPHTDRPGVSGRVHANGEPLAGVKVAAAVDADACVEPDVTAITDADGRFQIDEDRAMWTIFWSDYGFVLSLCIRPENQPAAATFSFGKYERFSIDLDCESRPDGELDCRRT